jgi:hypothetical protein
MLGIVIVPSSCSASPKSISILPEADFNRGSIVFFCQVLSSTAMSSFRTRNDALIPIRSSPRLLHSARRFFSNESFPASYY